ncbi:hypothetical protein [Stappia sp. ES.058]|uniref:hypothetical protein n=1 Tax=Stappia sp. ES.058 TaxID=1881061 RepID=UPI001FCD6ADE|nr:hypothetical protein [Stappia sp. ES.058]
MATALAANQPGSAHATSKTVQFRARGFDDIRVLTDTEVVVMRETDKGDAIAFADFLLPVDGQKIWIVTFDDRLSGQAKATLGNHGKTWPIRLHFISPDTRSTVDSQPGPVKLLSRKPPPHDPQIHQPQQRPRLDIPSARRLRHTGHLPKSKSQATPPRLLIIVDKTDFAK